MSESTNRGQWRVALERLPPFVLSLSKDAGWASSHACFDKLSTNGSSPSTISCRFHPRSNGRKPDVHL